MTGIQLDLIERRFGMRWLPDETLFSLCSRYHRVAGETRPTRTSSRLFGDARAGLHTDVPSRLNEFSVRTFGELGSPSAILEHHTLLPYLLAFASRENDLIARWIAAHGGKMSALKPRLGLMAGGVNSSQLLKFCLECARDDKDLHGLAYWRRMQQLPSSLVCAKHHAWLTTYPNERQRVTWALPSLAGDVPDRPGEQVGDLTIALANLGEELALWVTEDRLEVDRVQWAYLDELASRGYEDAPPYAKACVAFQSFIQECVAQGIPAFRWTGKEGMLHFIKRMVHGEPFAHPAKHLLFILWLFGTWSRFFERYARTIPGQKCLDLKRLMPPSFRFAAHPAKPAPFLSVELCQ